MSLNSHRGLKRLLEWEKLHVLSESWLLEVDSQVDECTAHKTSRR